MSSIVPQSWPFPEPGYMHPKQLKEKYPALSDMRLALMYGKNVRSIERYLQPGDKESLPDHVLKQTWLIDFYLSHLHSA